MSESQISTSRALVHDRILAVASEQFLQHGIRSVRMDDLAKLVGISKRTLYEEFADKQEVLKACLVKMQEEIEHVYGTYLQESENILAVFLKVLRHYHRSFAKTNPKYFEEMGKYPELKEMFQARRDERCQKMKYFLGLGIQQGVFSPDLNVDIFIQMNMAMQEYGIIQRLSETFGLQEAFKSAWLYALRGICTQSGIAMIDEFMDELKTTE